MPKTNVFLPYKMQFQRSRTNKLKAIVGDIKSIYYLGLGLYFTNSAYKIMLLYGPKAILG